MPDEDGIIVWRTDLTITQRLRFKYALQQLATTGKLEATS
jgi:hypothetical protein